MFSKYRFLSIIVVIIKISVHIWAYNEIRLRIFVKKKSPTLMYFCKTRYKYSGDDSRDIPKAKALLITVL